MLAICNMDSAIGRTHTSIDDEIDRDVKSLLFLDIVFHIEQWSGKGMTVSWKLLKQEASNFETALAIANKDLAEIYKDVNGYRDLLKYDAGLFWLRLLQPSEGAPST